MLLNLQLQRTEGCFLIKKPGLCTGLALVTHHIESLVITLRRIHRKSIWHNGGETVWLNSFWLVLTRQIALTRNVNRI